MDSEQHVTHSVSFRVILGLSYLVVVNLLSGLFAEAFRYPSLWGNETGIFEEYAYPVLFAWAMAHWLSMLPAALLVMGMPLWTRNSLIRARWLAFGVLVLCLVVEMSERLGRFQQIPFVLFIAVDALVFLFLSFCFKTPVKWILGIASVIGLIVSAWFLIPALGTTLSQLPRAEAGASGLIAEVDLVVDWNGNSAVYYMVLTDVVEPNVSPSPAEICAASEARYQAALRHDPPPEKLPEASIQFMAKAWFDESHTVLFDAGSAAFNPYGEWVCDFQYPVEEGAH